MGCGGSKESANTEEPNPPPEVAQVKQQPPEKSQSRPKLSHNPPDEPNKKSNSQVSKERMAARKDKKPVEKKKAVKGKNKKVEILDPDALRDQILKETETIDGELNKMGSTMMAAYQAQMPYVAPPPPPAYGEVRGGYDNYGYGAIPEPEPEPEPEQTVDPTKFLTQEQLQFDNSKFRAANSGGASASSPSNKPGAASPSNKIAASSVASPTVGRGGGYGGDDDFGGGGSGGGDFNAVPQTQPAKSTEPETHIDLDDEALMDDILGDDF